MAEAALIVGKSFYRTPSTHQSRAQLHAIVNNVQQFEETFTRGVLMGLRIEIITHWEAQSLTGNRVQLRTQCALCYSRPARTAFMAPEAEGHPLSGRMGTGWFSASTSAIPHWNRLLERGGKGRVRDCNLMKRAATILVGTLFGLR